MRLRIWLVHILAMAGVIEESQEKTKIIKRREAHRFRLLRIGSAGEKHTPWPVPQQPNSRRPQNARSNPPNGHL